MSTDNQDREPWVHKGEHTAANARPKGRRRHKSLTVELEGDLFDFLTTNAEANERTLAQEVRYWLKRATALQGRGDREQNG